MSLPQSPDGQSGSFDPAPPVPATPAVPGSVAAGGLHDHVPAPAKTNVLAILSLVFAVGLAPVGLVLGFVARKQMKASREQGAGLALAGIIISGLQIMAAVAALVFYTFIVGMVGSAAEDTGRLIEDSHAATGPHAEPGALPVEVAASAKADAEAMVKAQDAYRAANPGVPGLPLNFETGPTKVGAVTVTPSAGNNVSVIVSYPRDGLPKGGYCVMVMSDTDSAPAMFDSALDGGRGRFISDSFAGDTADGACMGGITD